MRSKQVRADLRILDQAVRQYAQRNGAFPDSLDALTEAEPDGDPYLDSERLPRDPWGNDYVYEPPGEDGEPGLTCLGSDGEPGGRGEAQDHDARALGPSRRQAWRRCNVRAARRSSATRARTAVTCASIGATSTGGTCRNSAGTPSRSAISSTWR